MPEDNGKFIAIDAKYTDNWSKAPRNPASNKPEFLISKNQQEMIDQAKKYSSRFDEIRYHTNSVELAEYYTRVFTEHGIKNFKFIITPVIKK